MTAPPLTDNWGTLEDTWAGLDSRWAAGFIVQIGRLTGFTLNDEIQGTLDNNVLNGGTDFSDIPQGVVSVSTSRGRNRDLERTNAGSLSVTLRNQDRFFDPTNTDSPFVKFVVPRKPVKVFTDGFPVFTGFIDDWSFTYAPSGESSASFQASDAFGIFARNINSGGSAAEEATGARIERVLDQATVNWPAVDRDIDTGNSILAAGVLEDNVLSYLSDSVEASEQGLLFMSKDGDVAFRQRTVPPVSDAVQFTDSGVGIAYDDVQISFGTDLMVNQAVVTFPGGTATAENLSSQVNYGITERSLDTQLSTLAQAQPIADYLVARYAEPEYRIASVTVNLRALAEEQVAEVLALELGDQADVVFTPNNVGVPIALRNRVIGVSHHVGILEHRVTFNFEELPFDFFILDDEVFGRLDDDAGVLGF
jgi:hypothetical protein